ncbi:MAG: hypothetical protein AB7N80_13690 [Bdellovibrionales bacterium]
MKMSKLLAAMATLVSLNSFAAPMIENDGGPERAMTGGKGFYKCEVSCIATCGRFPRADEVLRIHNAIGSGESAVNAFNVAVALCKTMAVPSCGMGDLSTPVSMTVTRYSKYEVGMRADKPTGYIGIFLRRDQVEEANKDNCQINK